MKHATKLTLQLLLAVLMVLFGMALITAAFVAPPTGHIDPTVLTAYGETLTFAGSILGLHYYFGTRPPAAGTPAL